MLRNTMQEVSEILHDISELKKIASTWPKDFAKLPLAFYSVGNSSTAVVTEKGEDVTRVQMTIHIFSKTRTEADVILSKVNQAMNARYWNRTNYVYQSEKYEHVQASFITEIDVVTGEHFNAI